VIPLAAYLRWRRPGGRRYTLWLPLFLLWLVLLPLALVLLPFVILALALAGARPFRTLAALLRLFAACPGTRIDIDGPGGLLTIHIF
jgi:uncharacterized membrane protein